MPSNIEIHSSNDSYRREYMPIDDMQPFQPGDIVRVINTPHTSLPNGFIGTVYSCIWDSTDEKWLVKLSENTGGSGWYSTRFELVSSLNSQITSLTKKDYKRKRYQIFTSKPRQYTAAERETIFNIYKLRKKTAEVYKLHKGPGEQIHTLRNKYLRCGTPLNVLVNSKYNINIEYAPTNINYRRAAIQEYKNQIREKRIAAKNIIENISETGFSKIQYIHTTANGVLNYYCRRTLAKAKYPTDSKMYIGIEIECGIPKDTNLSLFMPFKNSISLANDASIKRLPENYISKEFRILTTAKTYTRDISEFCGLLAKIKAVVNDSCGLHVHLDMRAFDILGVQSRFINLVKSQKYLQGMVTDARRVNCFCLPTRTLNPFTQHGRYHAINGSAYAKYTTLEIRLHHGSLDHIEITNWITLLLDIINAKPINRAPSTLKSFMAKIGIDAKLKKYVEAKINLNPPVTAATLPVETPDGGLIVATSCTLEHDGQDCAECGGSWDNNHSGHSCQDEDGNDSGDRGTFPGCITTRIQPLPTQMMQITEGLNV